MPKEKKSTPKAAEPVVSKRLVLPKFKLPKVDLKELKTKLGGSKLFKALIIALMFVFSFALVDLLVQYLNNSYSVAIVNGVRITRADYIDRLEKAYGQVAAQSLIRDELILQVSARDGITVTPDDVQSRLNEYYNAYGGKDAVLAEFATRGLSEEEIKEQLKLDLLLEKMIIKNVTYTDKELEEFFKKYKSVLYGTEDVKFADKKEEIKQYYINSNNQRQQLETNWFEKEEAAAKVQNNVTSEPSYGFLKTTINIVKNLYKDISNKVQK